MPRRISCLIWLLLITCPVLLADRPAAPQPLYRDPVFDGAADPVVIWNPTTATWWMFYTNRRANVPGLSGVAWVHGTRVSIAESADRGITWVRHGDAAIDLPAAIGGDRPTHWAPDVLTAPDGTHHMFLTVVPGVFEDWRHPRHIVHLTSEDLLHWHYQSALNLASDRVIDAGVVQRADGTWRLWYNNERDGKSIYYADSPDLFTWTDQGKAHGVGERPGEGPYVFRWRDTWWMLVDLWKGLGVYHSNDLSSWHAQKGDLLDTPGRGPDDGVNGGHPGVVICGDRAYLFYFTHPGRAGTIAPDDGNNLERRRSSIQVTELQLTDDGQLTCERNSPTFIELIPPAVTATTGITISPIAKAAFAGSSINTPAGFNQSLVSYGDHQYAGYYAPNGDVMIAERPLPDGDWVHHRTRFTGDTNDAHNTIALGVDGSGALHLAWGHHNVPLRYTYSSGTTPFSFREPQSMVGRNERSVTYPQFLPLPGGDLLCFYRDGGSGRGNFILNRFALQTHTWSRIHDNLIDGEGERSAYPSVFLDRHGTLHLAWVWRETPDVATNHDIAYARSLDGGATWTDAQGHDLRVPFNAASDAYAIRIPAHSNLMNPPALSADAAGRPLIANYWSETRSSPPQYHLLHYNQGGWKRHVLTTNPKAFTLAGTGTKRPLWSRAVISATAHNVTVLFRHDAFDGAAVRISTDAISSADPDWRTIVLPTGNLGAWEPTADASLAAQSGSLDVLLQRVDQRDGNDRQAAPGNPTTLRLLSF